MPEYKWPSPQQRKLIGTRVSRVDGPVKVTGRAKYTYDYNPKDLLFGKILRSPHARARIVSIDTSAAEKMPGVKAVQVIQKPGTEIHWEGDDIVGVAAVDEVTAEDAIRAIKVQWEVLPHNVSDSEPPPNIGVNVGPMSGDDVDDALSNQMPERTLIEQLQKYGVSFKVDEDYLKELKGDGVPDSVLDALKAAPYHPEEESKPRTPYQKAAAQTQGDPDKAFASADVVSEGIYGSPVITHCCLETHGSASEWPAPDQLFVHVSTQGVSGIASQMAEPLGI